MAGKTKKLFKSPRSRARGFALQGVYQIVLTDAPWQSVAQHISEEVSGFELCDTTLFELLVRGVAQERKNLERRLQPHLDRPFEQVSPIEQSVLLIAAFEIEHNLSVPAVVVIDEAISLVRIFGNEDGFKIINGVLDRLRLELRPNEPKRTAETTAISSEQQAENNDQTTKANQEHELDDQIHPDDFDR